MKPNRQVYCSLLCFGVWALTELMFSSGRKAKPDTTQASTGGQAVLSHFGCEGTWFCEMQRGKWPFQPGPKVSLTQFPVSYSHVGKRAEETSINLLPSNFIVTPSSQWTFLVRSSGIQSNTGVLRNETQIAEKALGSKQSNPMPSASKNSCPYQNLPKMLLSALKLQLMHSWIWRQTRLPAGHEHGNPDGSVAPSAWQHLRKNQSSSSNSDERTDLSVMAEGPNLGVTASVSFVFYNRKRWLQDASFQLATGSPAPCTTSASSFLPV